MTDAEFQEFRGEVIAFMARIEERIANLPCQGKDGCALPTNKKPLANITVNLATSGFGGMAGAGIIAGLLKLAGLI